ncbi:IS91 family transposase [Thermodesulfobacteriota bacterium]
MPELADVFRRHGQAYLERFGDRMLPSHRRAMADIIACRTKAQGGHLFECDRCGHHHYAYHSCRNRSCPKCHRAQTDRWAEQRRRELPRGTYFHLVFTLPEALRPIVRAHQRTLYAVLIRAAAQALIKLASDRHYVGGKIAIVAVLHTWTRAMAFHPHVHFLVPAGTLSDDASTWIATRKNYLVPLKALSVIFRAIFIRMARKALPDITIPQSVWETNWVVYAKPCLNGPDKIIRYLARYVHRIAITNNRILSVDDRNVTFRYKDSRDHRWKTMTLPAHEFIRRFLQHVLPKGFHKVRYYGLLSPSNRRLFEQVLNHFEDEEPDVALVEESLAGQTESSSTLGPRCPRCKSGHLVIIAVLLRRRRAPPWM